MGRAGGARVRHTSTMSGVVWFAVTAAVGKGRGARSVVGVTTVGRTVLAPPVLRPCFLCSRDVEVVSAAPPPAICVRGSAAVTKGLGSWALPLLFHLPPPLGSNPPTFTCTDVWISLASWCVG